MSLSHLKYLGCDSFNFTRQCNAAQQNKSNQLLIRLADSNINTYFSREFRETIRTVTMAINSLTILLQIFVSFFSHNNLKLMSNSKMPMKTCITKKFNIADTII